MFKKLLTMSIVFALFATTIIFSQTNNSKIPSKRGFSEFSKFELGEKVRGNNHLMTVQDHPSQAPVSYANVQGTIDTFSVRKESYALGKAAGYWDNGQSGFGMGAQDNMTVWYKAHADLIIKSVGFACSENANGEDVSVKLVKLSYPKSSLAPSAAKYLGYYPSVGDGYGEISAFPYDATGDWVAQGDNTALYLAGEYDLWSDEGFGYPITPVVTSSTEPVYQMINMIDLGTEPTVKSGEIFGVSIQHESNSIANAGRIAFWSGDMSISGGSFRLAKHYENGRNTTGVTPPADGGVWLRRYALDFIAIVDVTGDAAPTISGITNLQTTLSTESRNVKATIVDTNPGDPTGSVGVASAELVYVIGTDTLKAAMASTSGDEWSGDIPGQAPGSKVIYWVEATDVNGNVASSSSLSYNVFMPNKTNALLVFNGLGAVSGYPASYYFGSGEWPPAYSTLEWDHDVWAYGALTPELVNAYSNIIEIATKGPNDNNSSIIRNWLEGAEGRNYLLAGDEWLGTLTNWSDSTYNDGDFQKDILGIASDHNDINYAAAGDQGKPSMISPVEGSLLGGDLFTLHAQVSADSGWTSSVAYDPFYEMKVTNWLDGIDFVNDVEVDIKATGLDGNTYNVGGHRTLTNGNKVVFLAFDPLSLDSRDTDSTDGEYWWYGFTTEAPQVKALDWFGANIVGVDEDRTIPGEYKLAQNYPNPFNPSTNITFSIPQNGLTSLKIYNILGQEVASLLNKEMVAGSYTIDFNASNLSSGMYIYTVRSGDVEISKKMMLLK